MRVCTEKSNKPHCFELYGSGGDIIKACKVDKEGKVVEGMSTWELNNPHPIYRKSVAAFITSWQKHGMQF